MSAHPIVGYTNVAGPCARLLHRAYARVISILHLDAGRQIDQCARREVGRRTGQGPRADQRRAVHFIRLSREIIRSRHGTSRAGRRSLCVPAVSIFVLDVVVGLLFSWCGGDKPKGCIRPLMSVTNAILLGDRGARCSRSAFRHCRQSRAVGRGFGFIALSFGIRGTLRLSCHPRMLAMYKKNAVSGVHLVGGETRGGSLDGTPILLAVLYLVAGVLFHLSLAGPLEPGVTLGHIPSA